MRTAAATFALLVTLSLSTDAQWVNCPTPGVARPTDGKLSLAAPAPQGINEPALPLVAGSLTQFASGITATGFEFVTDSNGNPTAVRKESR